MRSIVDRLRTLPPRSRDRLRLAAECFLIQSALIAATVALGAWDRLRAILQGQATGAMPGPEDWLWLFLVIVGFTVIGRRTGRYRRAYPERPPTLELR